MARKCCNTFIKTSTHSNCKPTAVTSDTVSVLWTIPSTDLQGELVHDKDFWEMHDTFGGECGTDCELNNAWCLIGNYNCPRSFWYIFVCWSKELEDGGADFWNGYFCPCSLDISGLFLGDFHVSAINSVPCWLTCRTTTCLPTISLNNSNQCFENTKWISTAVMLLVSISKKMVWICVRKWSSYLRAA
jgi:hypothetical protein